MKNCFFLLLMVLCCTSASAQRYCDLEVVGGVTGTTINIDPAGATPTYFDLYFRNKGADTLKETDTVYFFSDFLTGGGRAFISPVILDSGGEINIKDTFYFKSGPAEGDYALCDSVWATSIVADLAIDTVVSNNRNCRTVKVVQVKPSGIAEASATHGKNAPGLLRISPNPASQMITINFVTINNSKVESTVYDVSGREVLQHYSAPAKGQSGYQLDVSSLQTGVYFIVMKQEGVQLSGKFVKQ